MTAQRANARREWRRRQDPNRDRCRDSGLLDYESRTAVLLSLVCECNLSRPNVKLRQFQIESINFVSTQVTDEESRAVRGNIAPGTSRTTLESSQGLQIGQKLRASLADLYALKSGMVAERNVVVKVVPVW